MQDRAYETDDEQILGLSDFYFPGKPQSVSERAPGEGSCDIADILVDMGKLTDEQHSHLRSIRLQEPSADSESVLLKEGFVGSSDILMAKAELYGLEFRHIGPENIEKDILEKSQLDIDFIKSNGIVPVGLDGDELLVATSEPENVFVIEEVKKHARMGVRAIVSVADEIEAVRESFVAETMDYCLDDIISDMTEVEVVHDQESDFEDLEQMAGESPVIKFVNFLISNAIREGASDIHIEPKNKCTKIRYRIDGVLFETIQPPLKMHPAIVSRIKIMCDLDISERRLPQDGKVSVIVGGRGIDLRVSTLPTSHGEKVVIRVLDSTSIMHGLEELGMEPAVMETFKGQVSLPHGILLVTGPTGSGKSTTLYTALSQMDGNSLNISTVEDPVEYELDFCNQVQVNEKIGLGFATSLRSLLRQDPDIIMIGEIRDNETARIAVQAALTGHLVLSTLHTNDAPSSITRLVDIGVDSYLIAASLNSVLAQRLVRRICPKCKEAYDVPDNMRKYVEKVGVEAGELLHGVGCDSCRGSGYVGRIGIYELLVIDERFRDMINKDHSVANMRQVFHESEQNSLFDDGIEKVKRGLTTLEEVLRVTEAYEPGHEPVFVENMD